MLKLRAVSVVYLWHDRNEGAGWERGRLRCQTWGEHLWTEEAERHLITISLKHAFWEIEQYISFLRREMWETVSEECLERHRKRVDKIESQSGDWQRGRFGD